MKKTAAKRDPLIQGAPPLDFDEYSSHEVGELTRQQKLDKFMSKYLENTSPISKYRRYFDSSALDTGHILREVKRLYGQLVLDGKWTEKQYVQALDHIFVQGVPLNIVSLDVANRNVKRKLSRRKR